MLRIAIADDEEYVLESIKERVLASNLDAGIVGFARNGIEALDLLKKKKPDVFLVDINMPMMDGMHFVEKVREQLPDITTKFVIISGYDDFKYLQRAMQLGVCDYLRKPIVQEELQKILNNLENLCLKEQKNILKYHCQFYYEFKKKLPDYSCGTILICFGKRIIDYTDKLFLEAQIMTETLDKNSKVSIKMLIWPELENIVGIYLEEFMMGEYRINEFAKGIQTHWSIKFFYKYVRKEELDLSMQEIEETMNFRFIQQNLHFIECTAHRNIQKLNFKDFEVALSCEKLEETIQIAGDLIEYCFENEETVLLLSKCYREIHVILMNSLLKHSIPIPDDIQRELQKFSLTRFQNKREILVCVNKQITYVIECVKEKNKKSELIDSVLEYLHAHFNENITLNTLSEYFFVTPTYLSKKFKEKCEINISQYLENLRIEEARKRLEISDAPVGEIAAEVGYIDSNYFSRVFKKATGFSPSEYRIYRGAEKNLQNSADKKTEKC